MNKKVEIIVNGATVHLVLGKKVSEWKEVYGSNADLWDFPLEELLDGTVDPNEDVWYWYINGRCYETDENV